jgi:hypothetical protein
LTSIPADRIDSALLFDPCISLVALLAILSFSSPTLAASEQQDVEGCADSNLHVTQGSAEWDFSPRYYNLLSPCSGNCILTAAIGRYVETSMSSIFFDPKPAAWSWDYGDIHFANLTIGRKLADFGHYISLEPEAGIGKRFGDANEYEFWGALYLRWHVFPWDHIINTTVATSTGVSYASNSNRLEEERVRGSASTLHYFSPEITLAPPGGSWVSFVIRLHHRSGAGGIFGESGGFQYLMFGLRLEF